MDHDRQAVWYACSLWNQFDSGFIFLNFSFPFSLTFFSPPPFLTRMQGHSWRSIRQYCTRSTRRRGQLLSTIRRRTLNALVTYLWDLCRNNSANACPSCPCTCSCVRPDLLFRYRCLTSHPKLLLFAQRMVVHYIINSGCELPQLHTKVVEFFREEAKQRPWSAILYKLDLANEYPKVKSPDQTREETTHFLAVRVFLICSQSFGFGDHPQCGLNG